MVDPYAGGALTTRVAAGNSKMSQKMAWEHNKYNMDTKTKNLQTARDVIGGLSNTLNLAPQIQSKALELYRLYENLRVSSQRKATHRPLMVAIIYIACKQEGFGRTFKELAKSTSVTEKEIRSFYKTLDKLLPNNTSAPLDSSSLVERFCARLNDALPEWVKIGAGNIARNATGILEGRQPATIAAASILLACSVAGIPMDHDAVAAATQTISGSTVQSAYSVLMQNKSKAVPPEFMNKVNQKRGTASSSAPSSSSSPATASSSLASSATNSSFTSTNGSMGPPALVKPSLTPAPYAASTTAIASPGIAVGVKVELGAAPISAPISAATATASFIAKPAPLSSLSSAAPAIKSETV